MLSPLHGGRERERERESMDASNPSPQALGLLTLLQELLRVGERHVTIKELAARMDRSPRSVRRWLEQLGGIALLEARELGLFPRVSQVTPVPFRGTGVTSSDTGALQRRGDPALEVTPVPFRGTGVTSSDTGALQRRDPHILSESLTAAAVVTNSSFSSSTQYAVARLVELGVVEALARRCAIQDPELFAIAAPHAEARFTDPKREPVQNPTGWLLRLFQDPGRYGFTKIEGRWQAPLEGKTAVAQRGKRYVAERDAEIERRRAMYGDWFREKLPERPPLGGKAAREQAAMQRLQSDKLLWDALTDAERTSIEGLIRQRFGPLFANDEIALRSHCFSEMRRRQEVRR